MTWTARKLNVPEVERQMQRILKTDRPEHKELLVATRRSRSDVKQTMKQILASLQTMVSYNEMGGNIISRAYIYVDTDSGSGCPTILRNYCPHNVVAWNLQLDKHSIKQPAVTRCQTCNPI